MKNNFLYKLIFILLFTINIGTVNAEDNFNCETNFSEESNYKLYQYRVNCICNQYLYNKKGEITSGKYKSIVEENKLKEYPEITDSEPYFLANIKNIHKTNMNAIYKCAILNIQKKSYGLIKNDLIKKNASLSKIISGKMDSNIGRLETKMKIFKCNNLKDKNSIQKLNILNQVTYQTCKYSSYIEYLKDYNKKFENTLDKNQSSYYIGKIVNLEKEKLSELNKEIEHTYKIFPIAFQAYTEYENNISIHILLELIKDDYIVLRDKLHKSLNPINQVVYKISNAMKK